MPVAATKFAADTTHQENVQLGACNRAITVLNAA